MVPGSRFSLLCIMRGNVTVMCWAGAERMNFECHSTCHLLLSFTLNENLKIHNCVDLFSKQLCDFPFSWTETCWIFQISFYLCCNPEYGHEYFKIGWWRRMVLLITVYTVRPPIYSTIIFLLENLTFILSTNQSLSFLVL